MPRKVAFFDHTAQLGGAEIALCNLILALDKGDWYPQVVAGSTGPMVSRLTSNQIPVRVIRMSSTLTAIRQAEIRARSFAQPVRVAALLSYAVTLARYLRQAKVSVLHANSNRSCLVGGVAGRLARVPVVWHLHSVISSGAASSTAANSLKILARRLPSHVICNSSATAADYDLPSDRLTVIPVGVDTERFQPERGSTNVVPRVGMIARFAPLKGQDVFLSAAEQLFSKYPSVQFVIAGEALFGEKWYEDMVRGRALRGAAAVRVEFPGFVEDVPAFLNTLQIVVHPSVLAEGFGQAVVEAMMAGKSVVVSAAGGSAQLVEDGVTGRLVRPGDVAALVAAIDDLLAHPDRAAEMGRRAREVALERYDVRRTTRAIEDVYERVLARV